MRYNYDKFVDDMLTIRCSSTDRVLSCASSLYHTGTPYNPNSKEAREGTAGHEALSYIPLSKDPPIDEIASKYDVDRDILGLLVYRGRQAWDEVKHLFLEPHTEHMMAMDLAPSVLLRGTSDLVGIDDGGPLNVLDWKLGWAPSEHPAQLKSYACCARANYGMPTSGIITGVEVWVRIGEMRVYQFDEAALDSHIAELLAQVDQVGKQYGPGLDPCRYCPHQQHCEARSEWLRGSVAALAPVANNVPVTRDLIGSLYDRSRQLGSALRQYDRALDMMLAEGPVPLGDGRQIVLEQVEQDKLSPSCSMSYLIDELHATPEELDSALSLTKSGLERVVKNRARRGDGAAMMRDALSRLRELGALEKVQKQKKKVTRI